MQRGYEMHDGPPSPPKSQQADTDATKRVLDLIDKLADPFNDDADRHRILTEIEAQPKQAVTAAIRILRAGKGDAAPTSPATTPERST